ncbi:putative Pyridoxamine 5'-phosphate oxidase [Nitrosotalea devaniterrae]|uniref:Putative Pyridoxamine 5'-phosphate oxidase n=1 Tax=Nitrosotalea devaniterrae TaxID=1078905 RepID=A0A128A211_9ARCH|nr:putative Pyridoxamine 5'-phosphate oxidase [Candidatus Nitrosotalea devanaterra]
MSSDNLAMFLNEKYLNLETYKNDGHAIRTPVWFVIENGVIYVITPSTTGKVKRLNHNKNVRIVPSNLKGKPKGDWIAKTAYFANESESEQAIKLRKKKYGLMARLVNICVYRKDIPVVIGINI